MTERLTKPERCTCGPDTPTDAVIRCLNRRWFATRERRAA